MKLMLPTKDYASEIAAYRQEFLDAGDSMDGTNALRRMEDPLEWVDFCKKLLREETVPENWVPDTQFLFVREDDDKIVGMIDVRHRLNERLAQFGGHIGYSVRPSERRKGYAHQMLTAALEYCWQVRNFDRVMVNCLEENEASRRVILANGGVYESTVTESTKQGDLRIQRYWIARPAPICCPEE